MVGGGRPLRALGEILTGRLKLNGFMLASHHFMSREEIETPLGQERLSMCIFHVPVNGELVSMCEANAMGVRDAYYEELRAGQNDTERGKQQTARQSVEV